MILQTTHIIRRFKHFYIIFDKTRFNVFYSRDKLLTATAYS